MSFEQELLNATGIQQDAFPTRRKMLEHIARKLSAMPDAQYDEVADELHKKGMEEILTQWLNASVRAMNDKKSPPEFAEIEEEAPPKPEDDEEPADDDEPGSDDEPSEENELEPSDDDEPGDEDEPDEEAQMAEPTGDTVDEAARGGDSIEELEDDTEPAPTPKKQKKVKVKKVKAPTKAELERAETGPTRYEKMIKYGATKNRYGIYEGTKAHDTIMMLEKGASMAEIRDAVGDTKYNLKKALEKAGHQIVKEGRKFVLTHKDDVGKKPKGKKK
jgi:hypothetical protein